MNIDESEVGRFVTLDKWQHNIEELLCNDSDEDGNQLLAKLIFYNTKDCLSQPNVDTDILINGQKGDGSDAYIYPNNFIPDIQTETKTILNVYFSKFKNDGKNLIQKKGLLNFKIWINKNNNRLDVGTRLNMIMSRIDMLFNKEHVTEIGQAIFAGMDEPMPANQFYSVLKLTYEITMFN